MKLTIEPKEKESVKKLGKLVKPDLKETNRFKTNEPPIKKKSSQL